MEKLGAKNAAGLMCIVTSETRHWPTRAVVPAERPGSSPGQAPPRELGPMTTGHGVFLRQHHLPAIRAGGAANSPCVGDPVNVLVEALIQVDRAEFGREEPLHVAFHEQMQYLLSDNIEVAAEVILRHRILRREDRAVRPPDLDTGQGLLALEIVDHLDVQL